MKETKRSLLDPLAEKVQDMEGNLPGKKTTHQLDSRQ
jgi:hypothetical protein